MLKFPTNTTNVKILKKPTFVNVTITATNGSLISPWGAELNYQKDDVIINDLSGDQWCISRDIYDHTYIDGSDWDSLYEKFIINLSQGIDGITFSRPLIDQLFIKLKNKFIKNNISSLIGMKKLSCNEAIIATTAGTIKTLEGIAHFNKGDFIITGFANEKWPINRQKIENEYFYGRDNNEIINKLKFYLDY